MIKVKHIKLINFVGGISCLGLLALAFLIITPPVYNEASADSAELPVSVDVEKYLTVALSGGETANMQVTPGLEGSFAKSGDVKLDIATNNPSGYKLTMSTKSGETSLKNAENGDVINSIYGNNVAEADFPMNHWGYNMAKTGETATNYNAIPDPDTTLDSQATARETYTFNFGVKVDAARSGTYSNTLILSAVANPNELRTLTDLTVMQDMNHDVCANTPVGTETQLQDSRDNKWYWVAKLKDGNCWMTQNLDLDIPTEGLLAENTDIVEDWNDKSAYTPTETIKSSNFNVGASSVATNSWDMGNYYINNPLSAEICMNTTQGGNLTTCSRASAMASLEGASIPIGVKGLENAHYHIGNYYQWNTATAGTGGKLLSQDAPGSICPKNWQLPTYSDNNAGSFRYLFAQYDLEKTVEANGKNIAGAPLYITRAGFVDQQYSYLANTGQDARLWIGTAVNIESNANYVYINSSQVVPAGSYDRYFGYSVRCLAR